MLLGRLVVAPNVREHPEVLGGHRGELRVAAVQRAGARDQIQSLGVSSRPVCQYTIACPLPRDPRPSRRRAPRRARARAPGSRGRPRCPTPSDACARSNARSPTRARARRPVGDRVQRALEGLTSCGPTSLAFLLLRLRDQVGDARAPPGPEPVRVGGTLGVRERRGARTCAGEDDQGRRGGHRSRTVSGTVMTAMSSSRDMDPSGCRRRYTNARCGRQARAWRPHRAPIRTCYCASRPSFRLTTTV